MSEQQQLNHIETQLTMLQSTVNGLVSSLAEIAAGLGVSSAALNALTADRQLQTQELTAALNAVKPLKEMTMPNPKPKAVSPVGQPQLDALIAAVNAEDTVLQSAITFIAGVPGLISAAVTAALANGATAAQLAPLTSLVADINSRDAAITAALTVNTPTPSN